MSCYKPNVVRYNDQQFGRFCGPLTDRNFDYIMNPEDPNTEYVLVPCGKCAGCRLDRSKAWADRMLLEYVTERDDILCKTALFLTLTYDEEHVPVITCSDGLPGRNLDRRDFQLFMKSFRKEFKKLYGLRCRVFYAGEYGDHTFRPHFHAILFGVGLQHFPDMFLYSHDFEMDTDLFESSTLNNIWERGSVRFSSANYSTFCYVARYVVKKLYGSDFGDSVYRGRTPPFLGCSNRPGIGADYFKDLEFDRVFLHDGIDMHSVKVPRIVLLHLKDSDPEAYEALMENRRAIASGRHDLLTSQLDISYLSYLRQNEQTFLEKSKLLRDRGDI